MRRTRQLSTLDDICEALKIMPVWGALSIRRAKGQGEWKR